MQFRFAIVCPVAALTLFSGAMADQPPAWNADPADQILAVSRDNPATPTASTVVQIAALAQQIAQFAEAAIAPPPATEASAPPAGKPNKNASNAKRHEQVAEAATQPMQVRTVGKCQTGTAAWYGGNYVGRRTSSGERLDSIHATAAHRSLPLNSLARVTNLRNGRSVVVRVTDRGPLNHSLLIDMSPRAAEELRMKDAGLAPVRVEQVVEVPPDTK
jgi:rare lipoprotein A (peptidoglycan hydrolase)